MSSNPMREIRIQSTNLFFTSDTHFWHHNIMPWTGRPWTDASKMNSDMIDLWNETVPDDSDVWHLGDFCFAGSSEWSKIRAALHGRIHLVLGNHDNVASAPMLALFDSVHPGLARLKVDGRQEIWLSHFPLLCWTGSGSGSWNLHGHVHTMSSEPQLGSDAERMKSCGLWNQYDVGVDLNSYRPVSYNKLKNIFDERRRKTETESGAGT